MKKFPPKGYASTDYPLPHNTGFSISLNGEDETLNSTIIPLFRMTEACINPEGIEVNPTNANFAEENGVSIFRGSIVPRVMFHFDAWLTKGAVETDKIRHMKFKWMPIYTSFLNSLDASDEKTGTDIESQLELQHDTGNKDVYPLYVTSEKLLGITSGLPLNTLGYSEALADWGLSTSNLIESVAFSEADFYDTMQYKTNAGMLKKVVGPMRTVTLTRDRPYRFFSNNFTAPQVKRGNPYTFCGILFHLPQGETQGQNFSSIATTNIPHINISGGIRFDEWNTVFDQAHI